jgi:hypothetical protein
MFIRKWGATEWAQLLAGLALLAGVLSTAPSAIAAPLQAPPVAKSCKDFPAINRTTINLAGVNNNDSCIAAWITGCDLQVDLVVNADTHADLKSLKWSRIIKRKGTVKPYSKTVNTTTYGYRRRFVRTWISQLYPDIPGCNAGKSQYEWTASTTVTIRTKGGMVRGSATHKTQK